MTLDAKIELLQKSFLFAEFSRHDLEEIVQTTEEVTLPSHTIFIHENDEPDGAYIIDKGSVKIYSITPEGKEIPLNIAGHGNIVGEMAIIDGQPRSAFAETLSETHMLKISTKSFHDILLNKPSVALTLLKTLSIRVRTLDQNVKAIHTESSAELTLGALKTLAAGYENNEIPLTHEDLAKLVGITRPRLTEALHALEKQGILTLSSKKIILT